MRSIFAKEKVAAIKKKDYDRANQLDIRLDELDQMWRNLEEAAIAQKHAANNAEEVNIFLIATGCPNENSSI